MKMTKNTDFALKIVPEDKLLLLCARTVLESETKVKIRSLIEESLNWDYLIQRASQHRLTQLLYWNLKDFNVPETILDRLKENFEGNGRRNLLMLGELLKVLKLFGSGGITAVPYKGPVLALYAYQNLSLRQFDDLDIFVNRKDVLKVKEILVSQGYKPQFEVEGFMQRRFLKSQREYKFVNPKTNVHIEIHWQFPGVSFSFSSETKFLEDPESRTMIKVNNKEISSLSTENMFLILCIHASGHLWERLSWICDISKLIQSHEMDWEHVFEKADELGIKRVLKVSLLLAVGLFALKLPDAVLEDIKSDEKVKNLVFKVKKRIFQEGSENIFQMADVRLNIRENRSNRVKDLFNILFNPTNKEWDESSLKLILPPVSYILRFINVFKDY
ncbi:nucleotidyltransferase domain-containing protein [Methanobacterium paludis]|nr:nucleotidyltransferase family protein [Methanobacterium paludis]